MKTQKAQLNYLMISPRKVRLISNTIKGMLIADAQAQLLLRPQRAAEALLKLLNSAVSNAKNNHALDAASLKVSNVWVDAAPVLKRSLPRAQGRATSIFKRMSHVTIELSEVPAGKASRFTITAPEKKKKVEEKPKKKPTRAATKEEQSADLEHSRPEKKSADVKETLKNTEQSKQGSHGFVKRFFNRKSI
jgi:large subunit ribosomal protein L22